MDIRLKTTGGDLVADATVPDFTSPPQVMFWGVRVFHNSGQTEDGKSVYTESYFYVIQMPDLPSVSIADIVAAAANTGPVNDSST